MVGRNVLMAPRTCGSSDWNLALSNKGMKDCIRCTVVGNVLYLNVPAGYHGGWYYEKKWLRDNELIESDVVQFYSPS